MPVYWESPSGALSDTEPQAPGGWVKKQGWKPLINRRATDLEFAKMFAPSDITGFGVITGKVSNLYVLDEDSYKEGGQTVIRESNCIASTANGGLHHFFKYNPDVDQVGLKPGVYIEGKGEGGFIVLAPSVVTKRDKSLGEYKWIKSAKLADLPTIQKSDLAFIKDPKSDTAIGTIPWENVTKIPQGERHNSMRTLMIKKLNTTKPEDWDNLVWVEVQMYNNQYTPPIGQDPSDSPKDLDILWRDCKAFVLRNPPDWQRKHRQAVGTSVNMAIPDEIVRPRTLKEVSEERLHERELEKIAASTGYFDLDQIVKGFIPGHLITLTGETNIGKTIMCANFAVRAAKQKRKVLYVALEPGITVMEYIASALHKKNFRELTDADITSAAELEYISVYTNKEIPSAQHLINAIASENEYQLVIVDHIGYFVNDTRNIYQDQSNVIKKLALLAKQKSIPILMVAHINKEASKRGKALTYNDISGSAAFKQDSTDVWLLERQEKEGHNSEETGFNDYGEAGIIKVAKSKSGRNGKVAVFFREGKALVEEATNADYDNFFSN